MPFCKLRTLTFVVKLTPAANSPTFSNSPGKYCNCANTGNNRKFAIGNNGNWAVFTAAKNKKKRIAENIGL